MQAFKVGQIVKCQVETRKSGKKAIFARALLPEEEMPKLEEKEFEIIAIEHIKGENPYDIYSIVIDEDMIGWRIGAFKIEHEGVNIKHNGKKFFDITETFFKI
jgi:hypothetical protein